MIGITQLECAKVKQHSKFVFHQIVQEQFHFFVLQTDYKYYHALSEGVLRLQELGVLDKLHTKWWKAKRGGGACQVSIFNKDLLIYLIFII